MTRTASRKIKATVGPGLFDKVFGNKSFMHCLTELIKNARDWRATLIYIVTNDSKEVLRIIDNGDGMNADNRDAFASVACTTARGSRQSGKFCTGTKQMLFSQCLKVVVRTAPRDEPELVYVFEFTTEEYERLALTQSSIEPIVLRKNNETWPYDFEFGTELTYTLRNPTSAGIKRGEKLAFELACRLPRDKFQQVLYVDNVSIPEKEIVGQAFATSIPHPKLGRVTLDIYLPKHHSSEDELRLTAYEVGEATMQSFARACAGLGIKLHSVYLHPGIGGTITSGYLANYASEQRDVIDPRVADDPDTLHFIRVLNKVAPDVARRLNIKLSSDIEEDESAPIKDLIEKLNAVYDQNHEGPPTNIPRVRESPDTNDDDEDENPTATPAIKIIRPSEVEIDEVFELKVSIRKDLRDGKDSISFKDIQWKIHKSRCELVKETANGVLLRAQQQGRGLVSADVPGTPHTAIATFDIVPVRVFGIYPTRLQLDVQELAPVFAMNTDKLRGELTWKLHGVGTINIRKNSVVYTATRAGTATITVYDSKEPATQETCDIEVDECYGGNRVRIRADYFEVEWTNFDASSPRFGRPAIMKPMDRIHKLFINLQAPGYQKAKEKGDLIRFLWHAIAHEYARFFYFNLRTDIDRSQQISISEAQALSDELALEGFRVFEECQTRI